VRRDELADFLRRRRTTGLRREEVAMLAGMSVDYVVRLEQGRSSRSSTQLLSALARALRLSDDERDLARADLIRMLNLLGDTPALVRAEQVNGHGRGPRSRRCWARSAR
jgi:transcriptional regulator with XRE-family HTH domain